MDIGQQFSIFFSNILSIVTNPSLLIILFGSTLMGIIFGALPGLTATLGVALLTTLTYSMSTQGAMVALMGIYVGAVYGGPMADRDQYSGQLRQTALEGCRWLCGGKRAALSYYTLQNF